ncbi:hypothetical protein QVD17_00310 [Tagetes erecta]|uniref:non-specific serine/threonine protein kinase n=1 Tax=Tagetes erecta TaxID=13708 RepID=A0AAD8L4T9_TARER|nr:hypothetical protein QVD17_00310 [Tagetes erecta]
MMPALAKYTNEQHQTPVNKTLFEKYKLGKLLGYGAFAKVYHGYDIESKRSVAIKSINKKKIISRGLTSHIKLEITAMRRLQHPNIVRLHEVLANQKKVYFVLEFAKGGELFSKLSKCRFSEELSRRYFQQLISAVGYCHSRGVFHRDLKPENLLLDDNWNLKITDFGLSAISYNNNNNSNNNKLLHTMCGTPAYVAPEILLKKGYDGAKVDIWSCGVILYVFNAGYLPFNDPNLIVMYRKISRGDFHFPKWTSPELKRLLSRLLDTNPITRITIDEIVNDPWFKIGYKDVEVGCDDMEMMKCGGDGLESLNAFDIISFSSGCNLSSLFDEDDGGEMFLSTVAPEVMMERVVEAVVGEGLMVVVKKKWCVKVDGGQGQCGNFTLTVVVKRLTVEIVVVEVEWRGGVRDVWKRRVWPRLSGLVYRLDGPVAGD